jgi:hypothetical protein
LPPVDVGVGVGVDVGDGVGVGVGIGHGMGHVDVGVGLGSDAIVVLATRSLINEGPFGVPRPVEVFAVAPDEELPVRLSPPLDAPHPTKPPHGKPPPPPPGVLVGIAAMEWKSLAERP